MIQNRVHKIFSTILFLIIVLLFVKNAYEVRFIQDDAYTSFRYVENFVNGNGLVFNIGERVEGYTNFLWVMLLSGIESINLSLSLNLTLEDIAQYLSLFFSCFILLLAFIISKLINPGESKDKTLTEQCINELIILIPVFMIAFSTPMIYWGVSGMETSLFVSFVLLSLILYLKKRNDKPNILFIIISVINSFTRPEGIIFFALIMLHRIIHNYFEHRGEKNLKWFLQGIDKNILMEIILFIIPLIIYLSFRLFYYGYLLPNTFYAKTEFSYKFIERGLRYFYEFAKAYTFYGFAIVIPIVLLFSKNIRKEFTLLFGIIISWIIIVVLIGGDVLPIHRFYLPIMPLIFILFLKSIVFIIELVFSNKRFIPQIFLVAVIIFISFLTVINYQKQKPDMLEKRAYETGLVKKMKIYADWVNEKSMSTNKSKTITVAMSTIGAFSFNSNVCIIDIVGLTDEYIAHHPKETAGIDEELPVLWKERHYNAEYVLSQKPEYIIFPAGAKPSAFAECAIFVNNEFLKNYYSQLFYSEELHQLLPIFTRRENPLAIQACDVKYIKPYINANNNFLQLTKNGDEKLLKIIIDECDSVASFCPSRKSDALTIMGLAYYHTGRFKEAERFLMDVINTDVTNSIARVYLKNIFVKSNRINDAVRMSVQINKYSPDAIPTLAIN